MCRAWNRDIVSRGRQQEGGRIWFGGWRLKDEMLDEFDEECTFPCKNLLGLSVCLADDAIYTYNFDNIDIISQKLGIPWEISKDRPFTSSTTYISFDRDIETYQVSLAATKKISTLR